MVKYEPVGPKSKRVSNFTDLYLRKVKGHDDIFCDGAYFQYDKRFGEQFAIFLTNLRKGYAISDDETLKNFSDRLERSIKANRNLLYEELEPLPPYASAEDFPAGRYGTMTHEEEVAAREMYNREARTGLSVFRRSDIGLDFCYGVALCAGPLAYAAPANETLDTFTDRMERSIKAGRNLFLEEWKPLPPYRLDVIY